MLILPAIDLFEGRAVRLLRGDYAQMTVYSDSLDSSYSFNGFWEKDAKGEYSITVYDEGDTIYFKAILKGKTISMYEEGYEEDVVIFRKS